jgi:hypothetical protein
MLLLAVQTLQQPSVRQRLRGPTPGEPAQIAPLLATVLYTSIIPLFPAQQITDIHRTNVYLLPIAAAEQTSSHATELLTLVRVSVSVPFLRNTGFDVRWHSNTKHLLDVHLVGSFYVAKHCNITPPIVPLTSGSAFQPSAAVSTFGIRASSTSGRMRSRRAPIATQTPTVVVGEAHATAVVALIWILSFFGHPVSYEAAGTKIGDWLVLIAVLEGTSE